mmetsp:Transcript_43041/g.97311  ORF Transcript_43041/g.97311 Transcript_43041/m.97311 type:complete len:526 (-) Transcript_43041:270-1847(-)
MDFQSPPFPPICSAFSEPPTWLTRRLQAPSCFIPLRSAWRGHFILGTANLEECRGVLGHSLLLLLFLRCRLLRLGPVRCLGAGFFLRLLGGLEEGRLGRGGFFRLGRQRLGLEKLLVFRHLLVGAHEAVRRLEHVEELGAHFVLVLDALLVSAQKAVLGLVQIALDGAKPVLPLIVEHFVVRAHEAVFGLVDPHHDGEPGARLDHHWDVVVVPAVAHHGEDMELVSIGAAAQAHFLLVGHHLVVAAVEAVGGHVHLEHRLARVLDPPVDAELLLVGHNLVVGAAEAVRGLEQLHDDLPGRAELAPHLPVEAEVLLVGNHFGESALETVLRHIHMDGAGARALERTFDIVAVRFSLLPLVHDHLVVGAHEAVRGSEYLLILVRLHLLECPHHLAIMGPVKRQPIPSRHRRRRRRRALLPRPEELGFGDGSVLVGVRLVENFIRILLGHAEQRRLGDDLFPSKNPVAVYVNRSENLLLRFGFAEALGILVGLKSAEQSSPEPGAKTHVERTEEPTAVRGTCLLVIAF